MDASVDPALKLQVLPFSLSQQEVWLDQCAWPGSAHLNIGGAGFIDGPFNVEVFRQALERLVAESDALRLVPLANGGQTLLPSYQPSLQIIDCSNAQQAHDAMRRWWQAWLPQPFLLDGEHPPWRFALLRYSDQLHGLTIQFHHLVMDGWGASQVMRRWAEIYNILISGEPGPLHETPDYRRYIEESLEYRNSEAFGRDAAFWQQQLPSLGKPLFERRYEAVGQGLLPRAHLVHQRLPRVTYNQLGEQVSRLGVTLPTFMIAVLAVYLARTCNQTEIVIGLPSLNRSGKRFRETLGMFVGVYPLVLEIDPDCSVCQLLDKVSQAIRNAVRHQRYPLSELARHLGAIRQRRDSLFDVLFSIEREDFDLNFGDAKSSGAHQLFTGIARYPLGITLCEFQSAQDAELTLEASAAHFSTSDATAIGHRLAHLMGLMAEVPDCRLADLEIVPQEERKALLKASAPDCCGQPVIDDYISVFRRQCKATPDAVALAWEGGSLSYGKLDRWSSHIARKLISRGAGRESVVAIAMWRSPEMIASILGVGKAGAAFLPLDPDAPLARLSGNIQDSAAIALIVQPDLQARFAGLHQNLLCVESEPLVSDVDEGVFSSPAPEDLAYVLFTSGSTGRPKGVMVDHLGLARRLSWLTRSWQITPEDRAGQCTQATFDPSLIEILLPLVNGASIALTPGGRQSPAALGAFVTQFGVTFLALVPSTLRGLLDSLPEQGESRLRIACCGGEVLPPELLNRCLDETNIKLFNVYGPTETVIFASAWPISATARESSIPVGKAIDGSRIYILDERHCLSPFGVIGEIYLGGEAVARGYIGRPDLNRTSFFDDPFVAGGRIYRTGDLGWLDHEGNLHFTGRVDRQVKLRGYRIELEEIEAELAAIAGIKQVAVRLLEAGDKKHLHAWVAPASQQESERLRQILAARLPDYMLPSCIECMPELPVLGSGKVAYDVLPVSCNLRNGNAYRAASTPVENALLALWQTVLKRDRIGVTDNFFDVGGDSLAAIDILAGIESLIGRKVSLFLLVENPTVETLAKAISDTSEELFSKTMLHLRGRKGLVPLYFAASGYGDLVRFQALAERLADEYDFYMLQPPEDESANSVESLADCYVEQIKANGLPGILAGFSVGGVAALETARLLDDQGLPVLGLCLVDAVFPGTILRSAILWRSLGWLARHLQAEELSMNGRHLGALLRDGGLVRQVNAMSTYRITPWAGKATLIQSSGLHKWERWLFRPWHKNLKLLGPRIIVPGLHGSIFEAGNIDALADALKQNLHEISGNDRS